MDTELIDKVVATKVHKHTREKARRVKQRHKIEQRKKLEKQHGTK